MAVVIASHVAGTSSPSTTIAGMAYATARSATCATGDVLLNAVCSEYRLLWQTYTTGSFHSEASVRASWNAPSFAAPSPKLQTVTLSSPRITEDSAQPAALGSCPPTTPEFITTPDSGSTEWTQPDLPFWLPVTLPSASANSFLAGNPFAICDIPSR